MVAFTNSLNYRVEFLASNRGSDDYTGKPSPYARPGWRVGGELAVPRLPDLRACQTVLLHREGVSVNIPAPERYAAHKLTVASRRSTDGLGGAKRDKASSKHRYSVRRFGRRNRAIWWPMPIARHRIAALRGRTVSSLASK